MTKGILVLMLSVYALTLWIAYKIIKGAVKNALRELKAEEKKAVQIEESKMLGDMAKDLSFMHISTKNENVIIG